MAFYYDFLLDPLLLTMRAAVSRAAIAIKPENTVDLCCGTGRQLKILRKQGLMNLTGVDLSDEMIAIARRGRFAPTCIAEDATATGIDADSVELVLINLALHEKSREDAGRLLDEACRILKQGAKLIIGDYNTEAGVPCLTRKAITFVEFIAGGEHYANYKKYLSYGGLPVLAGERDDFHLLEKNLAGFRGFSIEVFIKT